MKLSYWLKLVALVKMTAHEIIRNFAFAAVAYAESRHSVQLLFAPESCPTPCIFIFIPLAPMERLLDVYT